MKCWYCGVEPMSPFETLGKGWYKCSECGATFIKILEVGSSALGSTWKGAEGQRHYHSRAVPKKRGVKK